MLYLQQIVGALTRRAASERLADEFISSHGDGKRYLLGRNEHSKALSDVAKIEAFVDDFTKPGEAWNGKPVIKAEHVPRNGMVVNCAMSISPVSASRRLRELGLAVLTYADIAQAFPHSVALPRFAQDTRVDFEQNSSKWQQLYDSLADAASRRVLEDVLRYRLTGDPEWMNSYSVRLRDQYFESFLRCNEEVFVDAGGFDGDTTEEFCRRHPDYRRVLFYEPSAANLTKARVRLDGLRDIHFRPLGLSDSGGKLRFDDAAGSASAVGNKGASWIAVTTLDEDFPGQVTFIKMDLEGWELKALAGCARHITEDCPKLAIAVYHHPSDFWRVFQYVVGLRQDYKTYLRHYTEGWSETILFFVPQ